MSNRLWLSILLFFVLLPLFILGLAHGAGVVEGEITFGQFTLSTVVAVLLGAVFTAVPKFPDKYKNLVAMAFGAGLGLLGIICNEVPWGAKTIVLYTINGVMYGVQAVGTYNIIMELKRQKGNGTTVPPPPS